LIRSVLIQSEAFDLITRLSLHAGLPHPHPPARSAPTPRTPPHPHPHRPLSTDTSLHLLQPPASRFHLETYPLTRLGLHPGPLTLQLGPRQARSHLLTLTLTLTAHCQHTRASSALQHPLRNSSTHTTQPPPEGGTPKPRVARRTFLPETVRLEVLSFI
jgi:hypothetical protein